MDTATFVALFIAGFFFVAYFRRGDPLPPGPQGLPVLGVAREHPKTEFWKTYAEWGRKYSRGTGIISFHILGRRTVVLNTIQAAEDLLNRRSAIYSDRPFPTMAGLLMDRAKSMFYCPCNERLKSYRTLMQQAFNASAVQQYSKTLEHEARVLVENLVRSPEDFSEHIRRYSAAVTMKIAYGYTIERNHDHFVILAEESMKVGSLAGAPGKWIVDSLPILRFLPAWFPGAGFKRQAKTWAHQLYTQSLEPHEYVKHELAAGTAVPSFTSQLLSSDDGAPPDPDREDIILWTAGAIYAAGTDTTVAAVKAFVLLMVLHPNIQKRAQQEVDSVIGADDRLPDLRDRSSMPYVECVLKEVLRWSCPPPLGLFHCTNADDHYRGYHIPAKTTVIANIWGMLHDEDTYPDPSVFDPDRFTGASAPKQRDPFYLVFGFGRRVCPGEHLALSSLFIQLATILATLNLSKALGADGQPIDPPIEFTTAIVSHVKPFKCSITSRSSKRRMLVEQALA